MGNASVVVQFVAAIAASGAIGGVISWLSGRRKTSAEVADLWNKLTKEALAGADERSDRVEARSLLTTAKNDALIDLVSLMIADLEDELGTAHAQQYRAKVREIEAMRVAP